MLGIFSMKERITFPDGFDWGSATAGHQIEGDNIHSSSWHREQEEHFREPSGKACNFWNLWEEDFGLLSELGHRMFRMSIEWSRIEPEEGRHDDEALRRYLQMFETLKKRNIKLCLTLHHFSHPQWFEEKGEFRKRENADLFLRHCMDKNLRHHRVICDPLSARTVKIQSRHACTDLMGPSLKAGEHLKGLRFVFR